VHTADTNIVVVINLFLGWTLLGWVIALAMAFRPTRWVSERAVTMT
jgi:hypothetical protein